MGQINTNNYPTVNSLADADLLIVENATNGTGTTTPKQLRENAIGTDTLQTSSQTVTGAINELKGEIDAGAGVVCYNVDTITSGYFSGQFSGSANLLLLHLTTDGTADATNGYMMMLSYSRPVARFAYGRLVDTGGAAYKQDVYADNTIICKISNSGEGTESDPVQVVILGIINAGFMLTPTAVVSDRDIIDGQGNTLSVLAEALTKTASGNPVVITDCAGGKARSLITSINAIQDLHGYDKPWAGGADKNLLPDTYTAQSASIFGLTVTKVDNGLRFVGVPNWNTQTSQFRAASSSDIATLYADGASSACFLKASNQYINIDSCRVDGNDIIVVANTTATTTSIDFTLEFMMYKGTAPTAFRPYSNLCPISGRTAAVITRSDGDEISEDFTIQLGTTVYGAEINWDTGVATVTDVIVDLGSLTYGKDTTTRPADGATINAFYATLSGAKKYGNTEVADIKCSQYVAASVREVDYGGYDSIKNAIIGGADSNSRIWIYDSQYASYTVAAFKVAMSGVQLCYKLATPTTIQLTPTQLEMLKGYNRVSIEDGSIELGYIAKLT